MIDRSSPPTAAARQPLFHPAVRLSLGLLVLVAGGCRTAGVPVGRRVQRVVSRPVVVIRQMVRPAPSRPSYTVSQPRATTPLPPAAPPAEPYFPVAEPTLVEEPTVATPEFVIETETPEPAATVSEPAATEEVSEPLVPEVPDFEMPLKVPAVPEGLPSLDEAASAPAPAMDDDAETAEDGVAPDDVPEPPDDSADSEIPAPPAIKVARPVTEQPAESTGKAGPVTVPGSRRTGTQPDAVDGDGSTYRTPAGGGAIRLRSFAGGSRKPAFRYDNTVPSRLASVRVRRLTN